MPNITRLEHQWQKLFPQILEFEELESFTVDQAMDYEELIAEFANLQETLEVELEIWNNATSDTVHELDLRNNAVAKISSLLESMEVFLEYKDIEDERNNQFLNDHPYFNEWTPEALRQLAEGREMADRKALLTVAKRLESSCNAKVLAEQEGVTTKTLQNRTARVKKIISALSAPK